MSTPPFRVLLRHDEIATRAHELARRIERELEVEKVLVVAVIEGARAFARLLREHLPGRPTVHEIRASSYGSGTQSAGSVQISGQPPLACVGRTLLLVEDIVDTGRTIAALQAHFLAQGARECRVATLLSKPARRLCDVRLDYVGFVIPDEFVIGFGMDVDGRYRELPDIVVYDAAIERSPASALSGSEPRGRFAAPPRGSDSEFGQQRR
jgi:hypoxanthine phosphoribosyltransferase